MQFERAALVVLDSVGIGAMPDADAYSDAGRDTLGHICERRGLSVPNLVRLGLANIRPLAVSLPRHRQRRLTVRLPFSRPERTPQPATGRWPVSSSTTPFPPTPADFRLI